MTRTHTHDKVVYEVDESERGVFKNVSDHVIGTN